MQDLEKLSALIDLLKSKEVFEFKHDTLELKIQLAPKIEYYEKEAEKVPTEADDEILFYSAE